MCLVDLVEETLEFAEALLYQSLTPTIIYLNAQRNLRYYDMFKARCFKNTVIREMICVIFRVYIHF